MQGSCISFRTHRHVSELETIRARVPQVCIPASLSSAAGADSVDYKVQKGAEKNNSFLEPHLTIFFTDSDLIRDVNN